MDISKDKASIEAILFISGEPVPISKLLKKLGIKERDYVEGLIESLSKDYRDRGSAIEVIRAVEDRYTMQVKNEFSLLTADFAPKSEIRGAVLKTLAIIAYKQPLKKSDLVKYRGSQCYEHVKSLVEAGLVDAEPCGKTKMLKTTSKFSEIYGLESSTPTEIRKFMESIIK
ncbi:MAG: SMC-Scp complex subunit ScpB [Candidatus Methanofastidiosa archaeon]|jgi:segregation and condensation protein B|nr:SMC-Scp complex subunit ScpB [Candidatus Methanofastidiosa archaeon]HOM96516.1 SMC-Scp complex subunit ScpB [Methanofastidiosum sp.]HPC81450.1 SMC-Scp complex subunit ScpB [Methanofastidiosum sp.]HRS26511.1 SMC-Scp complex subunit ScpB [Methanofastidiosum sp.]